MTSRHNIHVLLHGVFHRSFLHAYTKSRFNFIRGSTAVWLCHDILHVRWSSVSAASACSSVNTVPQLQEKEKGFFAKTVHRTQKT